MKNTKLIFLSFLILATMILPLRGQSAEWPVLKHYDQDHISKIAMLIGGIGTGTVSLGGTGDLRDWEIMNRPAKGFTGVPIGNRAPFFAVYTKTAAGETKTKGLMGPVDINQYESKDGTGANSHGIPRFRKCTFDAAYPFGQVNLEDAGMPVKVRIRAFNPLIPANVDDSSIPIAILRYEVTNISGKPLDVSVCGSFENFIGIDGSKRNYAWNNDVVPEGAKDNKNEYRDTGKLKGIYMYSDGVDTANEAWGTIALTTPAANSVSYRTSVSQKGWGNDLLDIWDDFSDDGTLVEKAFQESATPRGSLAVKQHLDAGETKDFVFYLTWHFPNRKGWSKEVVGNYYTTQYKDAWDVAEKTHPRIGELEAKTIGFVKAFIESDLPEYVLESALFNVSTLRSQTCFRTPDGLFFGWEGCNDFSGCCQGSCTHVWNYEQTTPFLFGELSRIMRTIEFDYATDDKGLMSFRVDLPIVKAQAMKHAAADGQMGTIVKIYRDWQLSGDDAFMEHMWPEIKKALEFAWIEGGWDADKDGVMEGAQHNTMDVEYYGPNPQMQIWYLAALKAAEKMAAYAKDKTFAKTCKGLFDYGSKWTDKNLFNGEYYIQIIQPPASKKEISPYLLIGMGSKDLQHPDFQLGEGCLVDQLVGQYMAHICDLGYLVQPEHVQTTLRSIMKYNYRPSLYDHFNNMRSFALGDEAALLMASFPHSRPKVPFPYWSEVMTGFEYTAAVGMLYEGQTENGLKVIKNVRNRYDGRKRSPFDEAECGHHYARAMAAYAEILALTGFHYSGVEKTMKFNPVEGKYFWANGDSWGTIEQKPAGDNMNITLTVMGGRPLLLDRYELRGYGTKKFKKHPPVAAGKSLAFEVNK